MSSTGFCLKQHHSSQHIPAITSNYRSRISQTPGVVNVGGFVISYPTTHFLHMYIHFQYARRQIEVH